MLIVARTLIEQEINKYLKQGFKVEINVWKIKNLDWRCKPSIILQEAFIINNQDNLWIRCCSIEIYNQCKDLGFICYINEKISNSNMKLQHSENPYKDSCILMDQIQIGVITYFPLLHLISSNKDIWKQGKKCIIHF